MVLVTPTNSGHSPSMQPAQSSLQIGRNQLDRGLATAGDSPALAFFPTRV